MVEWTQSPWSILLMVEGTLAPLGPRPPILQRRGLIWEKEFEKTKLGMRELVIESEYYETSHNGRWIPCYLLIMISWSYNLRRFSGIVACIWWYLIIWSLDAIDFLSSCLNACFWLIFWIVAATDAPLMIDSSLYKELMVTDGGPDEKIISRVWGAEWGRGVWGGSVGGVSLNLRMWVGLEGEGSKGCLYIMRRKLSDPRDKAATQ